MNEFDNYFAYRTAIKYGGMVIQEPDQPVNTVEGANEAIKQGVEGGIEINKKLTAWQTQENTEERRRQRREDLGVAATMPFDIAAGVARGYGEGLVGLPGDLISLSRALYNMGAVGAGESKLDAFIEGLDLATGIPTTADVSNWLDENISPIVPEGATGEEARGRVAFGSQLVGEILAPVPYFRLVKRGAKYVWERMTDPSDGAK